MEFILGDIEHSFSDIAQLIGYKLMGPEEGDHFGMVRKIGERDYPRFHVAVKRMEGGDYGHKFTVFIEDSKNPYTARYKGPLITKEVERIKALLLKLSP